MNIIKNIFIFYKDGFSQMRLGKKLWLIIIIKVFIIFFIIKPLLFPNILNSNYKTNSQKAQAVSNKLLKKD